MNLLTCILTENDCYKENRTITPKGVMVHSTGADNPTLKRYVQPLAGDAGRAALLARLGTNIYQNDWNRAGTGACVHAFIGKLDDGSIAAAQTLPWNRRGWHAGAGASGKSANDTHISFEICEDGLTDRTYFGQVYQQAVELTAYLCKQYALDPLEDGVVICHQEGCQRGVASNHADVLHWFPKMGRSMDDFRADVAAELARMPVPEPESDKEDDMTYYKTLDEVPEYYRPTVEKLVEAGALKGMGNNALYVSEDFCRVMTVLDRLGKLD